MSVHLLMLMLICAQQLFGVILIVDAYKVNSLTFTNDFDPSVSQSYVQEDRLSKQNCHYSSEVPIPHVILLSFVVRSTIVQVSRVQRVDVSFLH